MRKDQDPIEDYVRSLTASPPELLPQIESSLRTSDQWGINIGYVEGLILQWLIKTHQVRRVLEIGTQFGYSAQWILQALPKEGALVTLESNAQHVESARPYLEDSRVKVVQGDARETLPELEKTEPFDLIFIDANKKAYSEYRDWAKRLLSPQGLMVADNVFLMGEVFLEKASQPKREKLREAMLDFNKTTMESQEWESVLVPTQEGLLVSQRKVQP